MEHFGLGETVQIGRDSALLIANAMCRLPKPVKLGSGIDLAHGYSLHINLQQRPAISSACGLIVSITLTQYGDIRYHGLSRLGGILNVKEPGGQIHKVAVTAAHGLLDHFLSTKHSTPKTAVSIKSKESKTGESVWVNRRLRFERRESLGTTEASPREEEQLLGRVHQNELDQLQWTSIKDGTYSINWLGGGWEVAGGLRYPFMVADPKRLTLDADFALFELPMELDNTYHLLTGLSHSDFEITSWIRDNKLSDEKVHVLFGMDCSAEATVLADKPSLYLRGRSFPTRKILLEKPLGKDTCDSRQPSMLIDN